MGHNAAEKPLHALVHDERGVIRTAGALLTDASGHCQVSAGSDIFSVVFTHGVFVDLPAAPVWQDACGHYAQGFFECAPCADPAARARFERLRIWEADNGRWREQQGLYPVVMLSLKGAAGNSWEGVRDGLAELVAAEYRRHRYVLEDSRIDQDERAQFERIASKESEAELALSLRFLTDILARHHGVGCVVILDEYDAPITHARQHGF